MTTTNEPTVRQWGAAIGRVRQALQAHLPMPTHAVSASGWAGDVDNLTIAIAPELGAWGLRWAWRVSVAGDAPRELARGDVAGSQHYPLTVELALTAAGFTLAHRRTKRGRA